MKDENERRLYGVWKGIKQRCHNPRSNRFAIYGARGIAVCDEWRQSFQAFIAWVMSSGYQPGLQIDRIDNNGDYEPPNCQFVTIKQNSRNRRTNRVLTAFGETKCMKDWAEDPRCSLHYRALHSRVRDGWPDEMAITAPTGTRRPE